VLRRHRRPVSGAVLAEEVGVSLRTLYRDIESLKGLGAHIDGEAGVRRPSICFQLHERWKRFIVVALTKSPLFIFSIDVYEFQPGVPLRRGEVAREKW
jgi:hypothetical protein